MINKSLSDTDRLLLFRARPKIILVSTYEEAIKYYDEYRHNILGFISDVRFPKNNELDDHAGIKLAEYIRKKDSDMPIILQSTNPHHNEDAKAINASFIHKKTSSLLQELEDFIVNNFGFGDFIFRNNRGKEISRASDLKSLKNHLIKFQIKHLNFTLQKIIFQTG